MSTRLFAAFLIAVLAAAAPAQPLSNAFTYQGQLDDAGAPAEGAFDFQFKLFDAAALGTQVGGTVCDNNRAVADGRFTVPLDFGAQFNGQQRFLEIQVRNDTGLACGITTGFTTLAPRQLLTAAPHALLALNADRLDGLSSTAFLQSIPVPLTLNGASGLPIIRADNASTALAATGVYGGATGASGITYGVRGQSASTSGYGVLGWATAASGTTHGVHGRSNSQSGAGVFGEATAATGSASGGRFESSSSFGGRGVYGIASASSGTAYGVHGQSASTSGVGVRGDADASGSSIASGGYFQSEGTGGSGVRGYASATSGSTYGVHGASHSEDGVGVRGVNFSFNGAAYGVQGESNSSASGWSVYALGRLGASGTKAFRIDHPDDPANKYLLHYSAESPEVINFYSGKVTLDGVGAAVVAPPSYFAKINRDPRYTLTAVGAPMPMLHVAEEIDEVALSAGANSEPGEAAPLCSFRIAGGAPGGKVSWRVEAVRNDRWVQTRGAPVEVEKQDLERGTYQHPELYGQPLEKGMNYDAKRDRSSPPADAESTPQ